MPDREASGTVVVYARWKTVGNGGSAAELQGTVANYEL